MIKLKSFYSFAIELQQFKCNECGTNWCSIKKMTKVSNLYLIPANVLWRSMIVYVSRYGTEIDKLMSSLLVKLDKGDFQDIRKYSWYIRFMLLVHHPKQIETK